MPWYSWFKRSTITNNLIITKPRESLYPYRIVKVTPTFGSVYYTFERIEADGKWYRPPLCKEFYWSSEREAREMIRIFKRRLTHPQKEEIIE